MVHNIRWKLKKRKKKDCIDQVQFCKSNLFKCSDLRVLKVKIKYTWVGKDLI